MIFKVALFFVVVACSFPCFSQYRKYTFQQPKMGSPFNIILYSTDSILAANAADQAFKLIDTLNEIYSDYLPQSELNQLCALAGSGQDVRVSAPLFSILRKSDSAAKMSNGSFDITVSPVIRLWRMARKEKKLPSKKSIQLAMQKTGFKYIKIDTINRTVRLLKPGMQLDLGGIAKGESAQRAINRLLVLGFRYALIDAGGDIVAGDSPPGIPGWKVAINLPETEELMDRRLLLKNKAVTTSGDLYQYLEVNGVKYSHIINPATGWALTNSKNVTVIANNGTNADWLTKACSILPIKKAFALVKKLGAEVQIAVLKNSIPFYYRSPGFTAYFR